MRQIIHSNNSFVINNFVMKCFENTFYLLFSADSDQTKACAFFSCECPFNTYGIGKSQCHEPRGAVKRRRAFVT